MSTPAFRKGAEASKEASKGVNFARTQYFGLEDGKSCILRFLTDHEDWIVVDQHQMVPTKPKPADWGDKAWPEKMGSVCRRDEAFTGMYTECYVCDFMVGVVPKLKKPSARTYALACFREEVVEDGRVVGIKDKTRDETIPAKDGQPEKTVTVKDIVVVNQGYKNFFSALKGFAGFNGTVLDRDYYIKREGSEKDTDYTIIPMDPIMLPDGRKLDLRDAEIAKRYESDADLGQIVAEKASDDYYARFFDPRVTVTKEGTVAPTGAAPEPKPENDVDAEKLAALAGRIQSYKPADPSAPPAATVPQDAADPHPPQPAPPPQAPTAPVPAAAGMRDFS